MRVDAQAQPVRQGLVEVGAEILPVVERVDHDTWVVDHASGDVIAGVLHAAAHVQVGLISERLLPGDLLQVVVEWQLPAHHVRRDGDRKSTRLNSSHDQISYAVFCLKKKTRTTPRLQTTRAASNT